MIVRIRIGLTFDYFHVHSFISLALSLDDNQQARRLAPTMGISILINLTKLFWS